MPDNDRYKRVFQKNCSGGAKKNIFWVIVAIVMCTLSVYIVPYNWDSMTYHLSRIANWAQNESIAHYATHNIREIVSPVLAEFINLHVYILTGNSDYFFNMLQTISMLSNLWLIKEIALKIGCSEKYANLSAFLFLTTPIAFGEALSTQVDQLAAVWLLFFAYDYLDVAKQRFKFDHDTLNKCLRMAVCVALGYLTKPSVLIGMACLLFALLVVCMRRKDDYKIILKLIVCAIVPMVLVILPEAYRNVKSFSCFSLPIAGQRQLIGTLNPLYVVVNAIKNISFNLPNIYLPTLLGREESQWIAAIVYRMAGFLRVEINSPLISEDGRAFEIHSAQEYGIDTAVNPVITIAFLLCVIWLIVRFRKQRKQTGFFYAIVTSLSFLVFCCLLRWEPFVSRYMVSYFALLCPMVAFELEDFKKCYFSSQYKTWPVAVVLFASIVELLFLFNYHFFIGQIGSVSRFDGYFLVRKMICRDYYEICQEIDEENYQKIGLYLGGDDYEYPIWQALEGKVEAIHHVMVSNESSSYEIQDYKPDCIVTNQIKESMIIYQNEVYKLDSQCCEDGNLWLFIKID